jgi:hypothetical protein
MIVKPLYSTKDWGRLDQLLRKDYTLWSWLDLMGSSNLTHHGVELQHGNNFSPYSKEVLSFHKIPVVRTKYAELPLPYRSGVWFSLLMKAWPRILFSEINKLLFSVVEEVSKASACM